MVVTALGLDGLNDSSNYWVVEGRDDALELLETSLLFSFVLGHVLVQRVFKLREGSHRPVKGRNIKLVDRFGVRSRKTAKQTTVEALGEGEDRVVWSTRGLVDHGGINLLRGKVLAAALLGSPPDESSFVGRLVGIGPSGGSEDLVKTLGGGSQDAGGEDLGPVGGGEVSQGGTVDDGVDHGGGLGDLG